MTLHCMEGSAYGLCTIHGVVFGAGVSKGLHAELLRAYHTLPKDRKNNVQTYKRLS